MYLMKYKEQEESLQGETFKMYFLLSCGMYIIHLHIGYSCSKKTKFSFGEKHVIRRKRTNSINGIIIMSMIIGEEERKEGRMKIYHRTVCLVSPRRLHKIMIKQL